MALFGLSSRPSVGMKPARKFHPRLAPHFFAYETMAAGDDVHLDEIGLEEIGPGNFFCQALEEQPPATAEDLRIMEMYCPAMGRRMLIDMTL